VKRFWIEIFCLLLAGTILSTSLLAQDRDDRPVKKQPGPKKAKKEVAKPETPADSTKQTPFATAETLKTIQVNSKLYWYDLNNTLRSYNDTSDFEVYRYTAEKSLIYTDVGSVFQYQPLWFVYDFQEMNRPTYIAMLNKYPHQNGFFYNNVFMNDPVHGMYNYQFLSFGFTRFIETSLGSASLQNFMYAANEHNAVTSFHRHTKAAWTKISYKQGNFGYTDLDISFAKPITENVALQLGGFNRQFDGSIANGDHRGYNFRGELTWQYSPQLYFSTQFYLGRERAGMTSSAINLDFPYPRFVEDRDDYFFDLTWITDDSTGQRLHLVLYNGYTYRRVKDFYNKGYQVKTHINWYGFDANYNLFFRRMEFLFGIGTLDPKVSGTAFEKNYYPYCINTYGTVRYPITKKIELRAATHLAVANEFNPQLQPSFSISLKPDSSQNLSLEFARSIRIPAVSERYFNFDTLFGNPGLQPEDHQTLVLKYSAMPLDKWKIQATAGASWIKNEIGWKEPYFYDAGSRNFYYLSLRTDYSFWKIDLQGGGQYTLADLYVTSRSSFWLGGHFAQVLIKRALLIDAYGTLIFFGRHRNINFDARLDRFYLGDGFEDAYFTLNWRVVATVKEVEIFVEGENSLSAEYEVINNYREFFLRFRFGVNWQLWD